jgi:hypothetical protein
MAGPRERRAIRLALPLLALSLLACTVPNPAYMRGDGDEPAISKVASRTHDAGPPDDGRAPADADTSDVRLSPEAGRPDAAGTLGKIGDGGLAPNLAEPPAVDPAATCPQRAELALCLRFEGAVTDESINHLALTVRNVPLAAGPSGTAGDLGATSLISVPDSALFDTPVVTVEAWVKPRTLPGRIMGIFDYNGQYGVLVQPNGTVECVGSGGGGPPWPTAGPLTVGAWTSVTCLFDTAAGSLWLDGVKASSLPRPGPLRTTSTDGITVGSDGPQGNPFDGLIDNVRVWKQARTPAQICAGARACP